MFRSQVFVSRLRVAKVKQLNRRLHERFTWRLPNNAAFSATVQVAGVVFRFIVNQARDIYVSIANENGFPIIAQIQDQVTGWNEREPLPEAASAHYQRVRGQPGDTFLMTVDT
jgi:hypothetical protein